MDGSLEKKPMVVTLSPQSVCILLMFPEHIFRLESGKQYQRLYSLFLTRKTKTENALPVTTIFKSRYLIKLKNSII